VTILVQYHPRSFGPVDVNVSPNRPVGRFLFNMGVPKHLILTLCFAFI